MCAEYPLECTAFSCDSKAKVHIGGGQAVSRYHQLRTFFPSDDTLHCMDQDFPVPGYLIEPDGYLHLVSKNEITVTKDKLGREVVHTPSSGPLFVYNRCVKNTSTSIVDHFSDITDILHKNLSMKKTVLAFVTDGASGWSPKSNLNQFFLGRFWKDNEFDMLVSSCHAPGLSRYNPIEHKWSPSSKWLAGVPIPACLPAESIPPAQPSLDPDEKRTVFGNALDILNSYWDGKVHEDFKIISVAVKDGDTVLMHKDYSDVNDMLDSSLRAIKSNPIGMELLEEWRVLVKHMDRRWGMVCFRKGGCGDNECKCLETGKQATDVMKTPCSDRWSLPPVTPDPGNPSH